MVSYHQKSFLESALLNRMINDGVILRKSKHTEIHEITKFFILEASKNSDRIILLTRKQAKIAKFSKLGPQKKPKHPTNASKFDTRRLLLSKTLS